MNPEVRVSSRLLGAEGYALTIASVGFESRSRYAVETLHPKSEHQLGILFSENQIFDYEENKRSFLERDIPLVRASEDEVSRWLSGWTDSLESLEEIDVWIDISSMTRCLIARIFYFLFSAARIKKKLIRISCNYSHAEFSSPAGDYGPIVSHGPVIPEFSGMMVNPTLSSVAIFGVGYETGLAIGAIETLEPADAWAFRPSGHNPQYDRAIDENNEEFLKQIQSDHIFLYNIEAPVLMYETLESLTFGCLSRFRVVLIPFGLKLFAANACLVALQHFPLVKVWRVSAGQLAAPVNRVPSGKISSYSVTFDGRAC